MTQAPETQAPDAERLPNRRRRTALIVVPFFTFVLFGLFGWGLMKGSDDLPSALLDKPVPEFSLPPVQGRTKGLSTADLQGHVSLVNIFASWCVPCRVEHPLFMELSRGGEVPLYGINFKDPPSQAEAWLEELGDPYARIGADLQGRAAIEWGSYGLPETSVISADGTIAHRHVGPLSQQDIDETIMPLVRKLKDESAARMQE